MEGALAAAERYCGSCCLRSLSIPSARRGVIADIPSTNAESTCVAAKVGSKARTTRHGCSSAAVAAFNTNDSIGLSRTRRCAGG